MINTSSKTFNKKTEPLRLRDLSKSRLAVLLLYVIFGAAGIVVAASVFGNWMLVLVVPYFVGLLPVTCWAIGSSPKMHQEDVLKANNKK